MFNVRLAVENVPSEKLDASNHIMHVVRLEQKKLLICSLTFVQAMVSARDSCKRALVTLVTSLALLYGPNVRCLIVSARGRDLQCPAGTAVTIVPSENTMWEKTFYQSVFLDAHTQTKIPPRPP